MRSRKVTSAGVRTVVFVKHVMVIVTLGACGLGVVGCRSSQNSEPQSQQKADAPPKADSPMQHAAARPSPSQARDGFAEPAKESGSPGNQEAMPSRITPVGHAVAMAGLASGAEPEKTVFLIHDPADNTGIAEGGGRANDTRAAEVGVHEWIAQPRESSVMYGESRPVIMLAGSSPYTVVGAVVIRPADAIVQRQTGRVVARRMPDLSQNIRPAWQGLCAATSAADVLYCVGKQDIRLLGGRPPGPGLLADKGADSLIAGARSSPDEDEGQRLTNTERGSLAFAMENRTGDGSSAINIANGLRTWVVEHAPGAWRVDLDFLEKGRQRRSSVDQLKSLQRWAGAIADGGGCIVLLSPSMQWSEAVDFNSEGAEFDRDPNFPRLSPLEGAVSREDEVHQDAQSPRSPRSPQPPSDAAQPEGQGEAGEQAVAALKLELQKAQDKLRSGDHRAASRLANQVIEQVLPLRFTTPGAEQVLAEATQIAAEAAEQSGENEKQNPKVSTRFDG